MSLYLENNQVLFHNGDDSFTIPKQYTAIPYGVPRITVTAQGSMDDPIFVDDDSEDEDDEVMTIEFDEENEVITMSEKKEIRARIPILNRKRCESDDETITADFDEDNEMITMSRRKEGPAIQPTTTNFPNHKRKRYESDEESNYDRVGKKTKIASFVNDSEWSDDSRSDFREELYTPPACVRREYHDEELNWNWNASVVDEKEGYDSDGEMDSESAYYLSSMFDEEFNQWFQSVVGVYDSDDDDSSSNYDSDSDSENSCKCSRYYDSDSCELDSDDWDTGSGYETPL